MTWRLSRTLPGAINPYDTLFVKPCISIPLSSGGSVYRSPYENRTSVELQLTSGPVSTSVGFSLLS